MFKLPYVSVLETADRILLGGAGGGYDIFCGLPLYFALRRAGKTVFLANLSFSNLDRSAGTWIGGDVLEVTELSGGNADYFPERHLATWFREQGEPTPIYCFRRTGVRPLAVAYQLLVERLNIDTVVLVDGGTDSLMRGDEEGLGTPHEDIASIAAVDELAVSRKMLMCVGFGIDHFHGVCHAHYLEAVASLIRDGGFLGASSLMQEMAEVEKYRGAARAVFNAMPDHVSIVNSSVLAALEGQYGDHHSTPRTKGSEMWINPLMSLCWWFNLGPVARRILYLDEMKKTVTYADVDNVIERFRASCGGKIRRRRNIPV